MTSRESAMEWWNSLTFEDKWFSIIKAKELVLGYPDRSPNDLTGREIELIHNKINSHAQNIR